MALSAVREELIEDIKYELSVITERHPLHELAPVYERVANGFEALGICNLLLYGNPERFHENLIRSGHARLAFLRDCERNGETASHQLAISRWPSLLDVIVADDTALAREIVGRSPSEWIPDGEYEDDFCFVAILHRLVAGAGPEDHAALRPLLERFRGVVGEEPTPQYEICVALVEEDHALFAEAFERRLGEREAWVERVRGGPTADEAVVWTQSQIFIEGLAVLKVAEAAGFPTDRDYKFCPRLARHPRKGVPSEDIFLVLEREYPA
jgi:hypothetical protein